MLAIVITFILAQTDVNLKPWRHLWTNLKCLLTNSINGKWTMGNAEYAATPGKSILGLTRLVAHGVTLESSWQLTSPDSGLMFPLRWQLSTWDTSSSRFVQATTGRKIRTRIVSTSEIIMLALLLLCLASFLFFPNFKKCLYSIIKKSNIVRDCDHQRFEY